MNRLEILPTYIQYALKIHRKAYLTFQTDNDSFVIQKNRDLFEKFIGNTGMLVAFFPETLPSESQQLTDKVSFRTPDGYSFETLLEGESLINLSLFAYVTDTVMDNFPECFSSVKVSLLVLMTNETTKGDEFIVQKTIGRCVFSSFDYAFEENQRLKEIPLILFTYLVTLARDSELLDMQLTDKIKFKIIFNFNDTE